MGPESLAKGSPAAAPVRKDPHGRQHMHMGMHMYAGTGGWASLIPGAVGRRLFRIGRWYVPGSRRSRSGRCGWMAPRPRPSGTRSWESAGRRSHSQGSSNLPTLGPSRHFPRRPSSQEVPCVPTPAAPASRTPPVLRPSSPVEPSPLLGPGSPPPPSPRLRPAAAIHPPPSPHGRALRGATSRRGADPLRLGAGPT